MQDNAYLQSSPAKQGNVYMQSPAHQANVYMLQSPAKQGDASPAKKNVYMQSPAKREQKCSTPRVSPYDMRPRRDRRTPKKRKRQTGAKRLKRKIEKDRALVKMAKDNGMAELAGTVSTVVEKNMRKRNKGVKKARANINKFASMFKLGAKAKSKAIFGTKATAKAKVRQTARQTSSWMKPPASWTGSAGTDFAKVAESKRGRIDPVSMPIACSCRIATCPFCNYLEM